MVNLIGDEGQIVIEKEIRDRLGVQPGWQAIQILVAGHVELYFVPPPHRRSLRGSAKPFIRAERPASEGWDEVIEEAATEDFLHKALKE